MRSIHKTDAIAQNIPNSISPFMNVISLIFMIIRGAKNLFQECLLATKKETKTYLRTAKNRPRKNQGHVFND